MSIEIIIDRLSDGEFSDQSDDSDVSAMQYRRIN